MKKNLETGNVEGLTDYLKEVIEEGEYMVPEATALLKRIQEIVPEPEKQKEEAQKKENYLKNAEMQMDDDYGMIDGIINNGEKVEKTSIMAELKAARESREAKPPEKKEKHHEKKVDIDDR